MIISKETIKKFNTEGPRYTSYPTAPEWKDSITQEGYRKSLRGLGGSQKALSLYIHIPFCRSLCLFCGCMVLIRPVNREAHAEKYLEYLLKEINLLGENWKKKIKITQLHFGGGTPTFFSSDQLKRLYRHIEKYFSIDRAGEIAIEIDPRTVGLEKIELLRSLGFNRISMGVQDFDSRVQRAVNRIQPFEDVKKIADWCRRLKFTSVNMDLIYGLPFQSVGSFKKTIDKILALSPDRIALYSYAFVPWLKEHQNAVPESALPSSDQKLDIFLMARQELTDNEYVAIAMDHFAHKDDEMAKAFYSGALYRNFMGYTVRHAREYVGLGVSAIGHIDNLFVQNEKTLEHYYQHIDAGKLPIVRGKLLSADDCLRQWVITSLMCRFGVDMREFENVFSRKFSEYFAHEKDHIDYCQKEGLLIRTDDALTVTDLGKLFIRNVCMGFDWYLRQTGAHKRFSKTV